MWLQFEVTLLHGDAGPEEREKERETVIGGVSVLCCCCFREVF